MGLREDIVNEAKNYEVEIGGVKVNTETTLILPLDIPKPYDPEKPEEYSIKVGLMDLSNLQNFLVGRTRELSPEEVPGAEIKYVSLEEYKNNQTLRDAIVSSILRFSLSYMDTLVFVSSPLRGVPAEVVKKAVNDALFDMITSLDEEKLSKLNEIIAKKKVGSEVNSDELASLFEGNKGYDLILLTMVSFNVLSNLHIPEFLNTLRIAYVYLADYIGYIPIETIIKNHKEISEERLIVEQAFTVFVKNEQNQNNSTEQQEAEEKNNGSSEGA